MRKSNAAIRFLPGPEAWSRIQQAVKSGPSLVAVAWWGTGMSKVLPLKRGSILVVRADRKTMERGQTNPYELEVLVKRQVRVHTHPQDIQRILSIWSPRK